AVARGIGVPVALGAADAAAGVGGVVEPGVRQPGGRDVRPGDLAGGRRQLAAAGGGVALGAAVLAGQQRPQRLVDLVADHALRRATLRRRQALAGQGEGRGGPGGEELRVPVVRLLVLLREGLL